MRKWTAFLLPLIVSAVAAVAQEKPVTVTRDTMFIEPQDSALLQTYARRYDPRKALLYAAVVPGLGQVYNKKYWKLPLVYGGFYALSRSIGYYDGLYQKYRGHLFYNLDNNLTGANAKNPNIGLSTNQLRRIVDRTRRDRDFVIILMGGMYLLQMVDAHVDSHLKEFDLNPNLDVRVEPLLEHDSLIGRNTGVALVLRF